MRAVAGDPRVLAPIGLRYKDSTLFRTADSFELRFSKDLLKDDLT
jgi:hypothetical protein